MRANLAALWRYRDLLRNLVARDLSVKYKGSVLGFAWSLLHPLIMAAVYTVAFRYILSIQVERFPVFLLSGLLPWMFFAGAVSQATGAVADNGTLVRKVAFPRVMLPLGAIGSHFVQFLLMFAVVVPLALVLGVRASTALLALVPVVLLQLAFIAGVALITATAYVYFRDVRHLLEVLLQIWFWVTPVVYSLTLVPAAYRPWILANPMALFVTTYQSIVLEGTWPTLARIATLAAVALASSAIGWAVFSHHQRRFAELV